MKKRVEWVDIYRGLGMLLVVMGHVGFGGVFSKIIHAFHMPMWFFISGYFFTPARDLRATLKRKIKSLFIPFFINGIVYFVEYLIRDKFQRGAFQYTKTLLIMLTGIGTPIAGGNQWFLPALFFTNMIYYILRKRIKQRMILLGTVVLLSVSGCLLATIMGRYSVPIPWSLDAGLVGLLFFHIGCLMRENGDSRIVDTAMNLNLLQLLLVGAATVTLSLVNGECNMRSGRYAIIPLFFLTAFIGIVAMLNLSKYVEKAAGVPVFSAMIEWLKFVGKESLCFLCLNMLVIRLISEGLQTAFSSLIIYKTVVLIASMMLMTVMTLIYRLIAAKCRREGTNER